MWTRGVGCQGLGTHQYPSKRTGVHSGPLSFVPADLLNSECTSEPDPRRPDGVQSLGDASSPWVQHAEVAHSHSLADRHCRRA